MQRVITVARRMQVGAGKAGAERSEAELAADFEELVCEVGPAALSIAHSILGSRQDAEDALQDAFTRAYRALPDHRGDASLRTWFLRILFNSCHKHRRTWRRWSNRNEAAAREAETAREDVQGDPGLRRRLEQAVSLLPRRRRTAFVLRYMQGLKIGEIAEIMGCAEGTVKAALHAATKQLGDELGDLRGDPS